MLTLNQVPVLQVVGYQNSGKTTLITKLIKHVAQFTLGQIMTFKHDCHGFQLDQEGKDTWQHKEAGAGATVIQSPYGLGLTLSHQQEQPLSKLISVFGQLGEYDLILVEGYKQESYPKIVLIRDRQDLELLRKLTNIHLVVFWRDMDQQFFKLMSELTNQTNPPSFLLTEEKEILSWCKQYVLARTNPSKLVNS